ncbi:carboxypeptidase-like regulatory domain-containing protein [Cobetia marina]|uniref:carboxypeptidase-like regulatory domain-containing protein n=1 Tax=Cobetia marina TaxID=28258 RepID=UPI0026E23B1B|nr:carboxypeptidase-like regulatory domain-containing protein [Cobetia marina]MDO6786039.1 carboxypeptidase-like regulatory domain-containing protein [Cobetia marina]
MIIDFEDGDWQQYFSGDWITTDEGVEGAYSGDYALRSPPMDATGTRITVLDLSKLIGVGEGATVSFHYRKSTYGNHNVFYVNGSVVGGYAYDVPWTKETLPKVFTRYDSIEFKFFRNIDLVHGEDAIFIDMIELQIISSDRKLMPGGRIILAEDFGGVPNPGAIKQDGTTSIVRTSKSSPFRVVDCMFGSGSSPTAAAGALPVSERRGVIAGTVLDIQAQPVSRRVRVHERSTGRIVRETWSDADGKYRFTDLDPRRAFYVMAFDYTLQQNAVVSDNVHPELEDTP